MPQKIRVLLIEDVRSEAELIVNLLKKCKKAEYIITHARTLEEGLSYIGRKFFDVILLDLILPNSQGIANFISVSDKCNDVPIVIVSEHREMAFEAVSKGAQDYLLKKDITPDNLWRSTRYAIERKRLESEKIDILKKYQDLVKHAPAAIYQIDFIKDRFVQVNEVMCEYTGYTEDELLSMSPKELLMKESYKLFLERLKRMGLGKDIDDHVEYQIKAKDGRILWAMITANFIKSKTGKIVGANVIGVDITERKKLELKLKKAEEEMNQMLKNGIQELQEEILNMRAYRSKVTDIVSFYIQG